MITGKQKNIFLFYCYPTFPVRGKRDLQRIEFSSLVGLLIPLMLFVWKLFGAFYFTLFAILAILVNLYIEKDCWKLGIPAGLTACATEFVGPYLGLWYYVNGYPILPIFTGFTAIGCAAAVYASMLKWKEGYRKLYRRRFISWKYIIVTYYIAIMLILFITLAVTQNQLIYLGALACMVLVLDIFDREVWKLGLIFAVIGVLEEFIGVEFGLWGYEIMPQTLMWARTFPVITLIFEYFAIGCALCFLVSGLGLAYFRNKDRPEPRLLLPKAV